MTGPQRVLLGEVGSAHGIRGEVVVRSYTSEPADIARYGRLEAADGTVLPILRIVRETPKGLICRFEGIADRTGVENLRGTELWVPRERLPPPSPGDYYHVDLIGLSAVSPEGAKIGSVVAVVNFAAGDLLEIQREGSRETDYVPFTDACVPEVDIAGRRVVVVMPVMVEGDPDAGETDEDGTADTTEEEEAGRG